MSKINLFVALWMCACAQPAKSIPTFTVGSATLLPDTVLEEHFRNGESLAVAEVNAAGLFNLVMESAAAKGSGPDVVEAGITAMIDHVEAMHLNVSYPPILPSLINKLTSADKLIVSATDPFFIRPDDEPIPEENGTSNLFFSTGNVNFQAIKCNGAGLTFATDMVAKLAMMTGDTNQETLFLFNAFKSFWDTLPGHSSLVATFETGATTNAGYAQAVQSGVAFGVEGTFLQATPAESQRLLTTMAQSSPSYPGKVYIGSILMQKAFADQLPGSFASQIKAFSINYPEGEEWETYKNAYQTAFQQAPERAEPFVVSYDAMMVLSLAAAKAIIENQPRTAEVLSANMTAVANAPGTAIGPGEFARAVELLKAGEDIDYHAVSGRSGSGDTFEFNGKGQIKGNFQVLKFDAHNEIVVDKEFGELTPLPAP